MTKEKVDNQQVDEQTGFREGDVNPSCEGESCANVADDEQIATDTMAEGEEPSSEQQEFQEPSSEEVTITRLHAIRSPALLGTELPITPFGKGIKHTEQALYTSGTISCGSSGRKTIFESPFSSAARIKSSF